jgi:hypothetical protein
MLAACLFAGCSGKKPVPASRLMQPAGKFSFITPDGWYRTKIPGIDFTIVSTDADYGARPSIFVEGVPRSDNVSNRVIKTTEEYRGELPQNAAIEQQEFDTESGLRGVKITAYRQTKEALPLAAFHFVFQDGDRVLAITCMCAWSTKLKYEPIFDRAMKSLRPEK